MVSRVSRLLCPSCGAGIQVAHDAQSAICEHCHKQLTVRREQGEVSLHREGAWLDERPYLPEAHLPRPIGRTAQASQSVGAGCAYGVVTFTVVSVTGAVVAASSGIEADLTPFIALAAACGAGLGFVIGYGRSRQR